MTSFSIEDRVIRVLEDFVIEGCEIDRMSTWDDLSIDSLSKVEAAMDLEDEFHIEINDEVLQIIDDIGELIDLITRLTR
jgi:acyl carrier protein